MDRWSRRARARGGYVCLFAVSLLGSLAVTACSDDGPSAPPGPTGGDVFQSFEIGAKDASFYAPIDAVPMNDGSLVFLARATAGVVPEAAEDAVQGADQGNRTFLFRQAPGGKPEVLIRDLVLPTNVASDGGDTVYVADYGAGAVLRVSVAARTAERVAENVEPKGVTVAKDGRVLLTGTNPATRAAGVYSLSGTAATPIVEGGLLSNLSGIEIDDNGIIYTVSATGARDVDEALLSGGGGGVLYRIEGTTVTVLSAGFEAAEPTGIALVGTTLGVSSYAGRGDSSAVLLFDVAAQKRDPSVYSNDKLREISSSGGLHRNRKTGLMAWAGGDTVFVIKP